MKVGMMKAGMTGLSLMELLAVMVVLAIVAGVSVPSFARIVERQQLEAAMLRLESGIALARDAAMMRGRGVAVCPRSLSGGCAPGMDWSGGWVVFVEASGHFGQVGEMLWVQSSFAGDSSALTLHANRGLLRYQPDGSSAGSNLTLSLCLRGEVRMQQIISNTGRARRHQPELGTPCPA